MRLRVALRCAVAFLIFGASVGLRADAPLRLRLEKGQKFLYRYEINNETNMTVPIPDNEQTITQTTKQTQVMEQRVLDVDEEGIATVEVKTTHAAVQANMGPLGSFGYDSDSGNNDPDSPLTPIYEKFLNKPFTMRITPRGKVLEVKGLSDLLAGAAGQDHPMLGQFGAAFSDAELSAMCQTFAPLYPEEPQSSWTQENDMTVPIVGKVHSRSDYVSLGEKVVRDIPAVVFDVTTTMESENDIGNKIIAGPLEMLVRMDSMTMNGTMSVGASDGYAVDAKLTMTGRMTMTAAMQATDDNPGIAPMMMTAGTKMTVLIERLKWETDEE